MLHFGAEAFCAAWSVCSEKSRRCCAESAGGVSRLGTSSCPCVIARSAGKVCVTCLLPACLIGPRGLTVRLCEATWAPTLSAPGGFRLQLAFDKSDHEIAKDPLVQPYKHISVRGNFRNALCKILSLRLTLYFIYPYIIYLFYISTHWQTRSQRGAVNTKALSHITSTAAPCEELCQEIILILSEIVTNILILITFA